MTVAKRIAGAATLGIGVLVGCGVSVGTAQAGYTVALTQQGPNVVARGSGAIDLLGLTPAGTEGVGAGLIPMVGDIFTGPATLITSSVYTDFAGPTNFGTGGVSVASSGSGDTVAMIFDEGLLAVPLNYSSGGALSDMSTYNNQTFASLGVTPGTYVWTWGGGGSFRNFTLIVGAAGAAIPEPASAALLGSALAGLLLAATIRSIRPTR